MQRELISSHWLRLATFGASIELKLILDPHEIQNDSVFGKAGQNGLTVFFCDFNSKELNALHYQARWV